MGVGAGAVLACAAWATSFVVALDEDCGRLDACALQLDAVAVAVADIDAWWAQVGTNLRLGRLRLVFVADLISRELRRIIEFLNEQMTQTEVIGVEVRQYVDASGEYQTIVPRLIGQTEAARDIKTRASASGVRRYDVSMADLIDAGPIPAEGELTSHLRGGDHQARYTRATVEHAGVIHRSPSMAAAAAIGGKVNGWEFWYVEVDGQKTLLADLRTAVSERPRRVSTCSHAR